MVCWFLFHYSASTRLLGFESNVMHPPHELFHPYLDKSIEYHSGGIEYPD